MRPLIEQQTEPRPQIETFDPSTLGLGKKGILDFQIAEAPDGSRWGISILFVKGSQEGPTLLVNGGTHGDEYEGPVPIHELFAELSPDQIRGTWLGVPVLNEPAMSIPQRYGKFDGQDLARVFPGKADGTVTEQIAFRFGHSILKHANYYVDLHSAGSVFRMIFLSGYCMVSDSKVLDQQRKISIAFGGDLIWGTPFLPGRTLSQAADFGIPAIYAETTGTGGLKRSDVELYKEGVKNVMRSIGMLNGDYPHHPSRFFRETASHAQNEGFLQLDHPAPCKGLFLPAVDLWDRVTQGQEVGRIVDAAGRTLARVNARRDGHVILVRHSLSVNEQDGLVVVVEGLEESGRK